MSTCKILEKSNDPISRKCSAGQTDEQTDRQTNGQTDRLTDERQWFHKTYFNWRRMSKILAEKLMFSEMCFVWTTSNLIGKHSFYERYFFRKTSLWKKHFAFKKAVRWRRLIFCFLYPRGWKYFALHNIIKLNNVVLFSCVLKTFLIKRMENLFQDFHLFFFFFFFFL